MALSVKMVVGKNGTELGMRKDGDNDFGTFVPNYLGNSMSLVITAYSDGTDFIMVTDGKIDTLGAISLTSASGAKVDLTWDAGLSAYKGPVGAVEAVLLSHYDGMLDLMFDTGTPPPVVAPPTGVNDPTASNITAVGFKVDWTGTTGGDPVDNYIVHVTKAGTDITGSPFTMAGTTTSKTVSGLTASTAYSVTLEAKNAGGSASSSAVTVTTIA